MEIIHIILGKANPDRMNGVNKVVYQLASKQVKMGRNVEVWGITQSLHHDYGLRNFKTRLFERSKNPFHISSEMKLAISSLSRDVVFHIHGGWIPIFWTISRLLSASNRPFVFTPHGAYNAIAMERSPLRKLIYFSLFERSLIRKAELIHCLGASEVDGLKRLYPVAKSKLLPYGFEAPSIAPKVKCEQGQFIIGFMGRIDIRTKGLDILLSAFSIFKDKCANAELWILGDGADRPELEAMISEHQLNGYVTMWGGVFGEEKWNLMQRMHVFTHPSRNEGVPTAVLEAASLGIPSVVSIATNMSAYVQKYSSGIVIPDEAANDLANSLEILYSEWKHDKLQLRASNAKNMVQQAFDWEKIVLEFDKLYSPI